MRRMMATMYLSSMVRNSTSSFRFNYPDRPLGSDGVASSPNPMILDSEDENTTLTAEELAAHYKNKYSSQQAYSHGGSTLSHAIEDLHATPGGDSLVKALQYSDINDPVLYRLTLRRVSLIIIPLLIRLISR